MLAWSTCACRSFPIIVTFRGTSTKSVYSNKRHRIVWEQSRPSAVMWGASGRFVLNVIIKALHLSNLFARDTSSSAKNWFEKLREEFPRDILKGSVKKLMRILCKLALVGIHPPKPWEMWCWRPSCGISIMSDLLEERWLVVQPAGDQSQRALYAHIPSSIELRTAMSLEHLSITEPRTKSRLTI